MKITEQTLRELLIEPKTIADLVAGEPTERSLAMTCHFQEVAKGLRGKEATEATAFHHHVEHCPACSNHVKAMCDEGRRLLNEWACSYTDSRVN